MDRTKRNRLIAAAGLAVLFGLTVTLAAQLLLRHGSALLSSPALKDIFAQIRSASMRSPAGLTAVIAFCYWYPVCRFCRRPAARVFAVLGGVLLWLLLTAVCAALTRVNGIRFGDVLFSLLDAAEKGWLDSL